LFNIRRTVRLAAVKSSADFYPGTLAQQRGADYRRVHIPNTASVRLEVSCLILVPGAQIPPLSRHVRVAVDPK
jgi:hypothetical protein